MLLQLCSACVVCLQSYDISMSSRTAIYPSAKDSVADQIVSVSSRASDLFHDTLDINTLWFGQVMLPSAFTICDVVELSASRFRDKCPYSLTSMFSASSISPTTLTSGASLALEHRRSRRRVGLLSAVQVVCDTGV